MALHWLTIDALAKDRINEYRREVERIRLEDAVQKSCNDGALLGRLWAALDRRIALARAGKPSFGEQEQN